MKAREEGRRRALSDDFSCRPQLLPVSDLPRDVPIFRRLSHSVYYSNVTDGALGPCYSNDKPLHLNRPSTYFFTTIVKCFKFPQSLFEPFLVPIGEFRTMNE